MTARWDAEQALEAIERRYSNKRSLAYGLLQEVRAIATQMISQAEAAAEARADGRIAEVERRREHEQSMLETYRTRVRQLEDQLDEKRRLREEREQAGEEVQVQIGRSLGGSWLVGDLEEVVYRLRCGGATDETPVKITDYTATAKVVAPELVPLVRPSEAKVAPFAPDLDIVEMRRESLLELPAPALIGLAVFVTAVLMLLGRWVL